VASFRDYVKLTRPHQLIKNGFLFLPLFFGNKLTDAHALGQVCLGFLCFSLAGMTVYVFNDLRDAEDDRLHPVKRNRPIAAGSIGVKEACVMISAFALLSLCGGSLLLGWLFTSILGAYLVLNITYTLGLKHIAVLDVTCIAVGFVMRVYAGGAAGQVRTSHWIVLMTFLLALFLALAKRRDDLHLAKSGAKMRKSLDGYNMEMVSAGMNIMAAVTIVSYVMYTVSPEVVAFHSSRHLYLTSFWVVIGIMRYLQITYVQSKSGSPTMILLQDVFLIVVILSWLASIFVMKYVFSH
jgi:4-hydroxybenzoate polyprenyltransferase